MNRAVALWLILSFPLCATAQDAVLRVTENMPEVSIEPLNSGDGAAIIHAGTDKKIAYLRIKKRSLGATPWRWDAAFQAPYDSEDDPSVLGNFDGLTTSTNLELNLQRIKISTSEYPVVLKSKYDELCQQYGVPAGEGCGDDDVEQIVIKKEDEQKICMTLSKEACAEKAKAIAKIFRDRRRSISQELANTYSVAPLEAWIFGFGGKVGVKQFKYLDAVTFEEQKTNKSPWSLSGYLYFKRGPDSYGGGIEFQDSYKAQPKVSLCSPSDSNPMIDICKDAVLGGPARQERKIAYMQWNHHRRGDYFAISPRVSYDFEKDDTGVYIPVYLIRNKEGLFTGGLNVSWQSETDEVVAGIFVGRAFTYF